MEHYSLRGILGYNCKYTLVLSDRGRGKSFDAKHFLMRQPGSCMCLYRTSSDMQMAMKSWVDPLVSGSKDLEKYEVYEYELFEWDGNDKEGYILSYGGVKKVWFRYLTQVNHIKQEVFPDDMDWVLLDEFIPMAYKKLPGIESEGDAIRTIIKTIEHDSLSSREERGLKRVRMIMFANPFTWNNPILSYFRVQPRYGRYRAGPDIAIEMLKPLEVQKGKMNVDTFLGDEVNINQGWMKQLSYVKEKWPVVHPRMSLRFGNAYYTIYCDEVHEMYVKRMKDHTNCVRYSEGICEEGECMMTTKLRKWLKSNTYGGGFYYKDLNTKFDFQNAVYGMKS